MEKKQIKILIKSRKYQDEYSYALFLNEFTIGN